MHAHCYLHRPSLLPFGHRIPVAPHYLLKLKSCDAIRMVRLLQVLLLLGSLSLHHAHRGGGPCDCAPCPKC